MNKWCNGQMMKCCNDPIVNSFVDSQTDFLYSLSVNKIAGVAQLVEQLIRNQQVDGSSPPASSKQIEEF